jgi:hypothetical protein
MCRNVLIACAAVSAALVFPATLTAQAWLPPPGEGTLTITYQGLFSDTHLDRSGQPFNPAEIRGNTVLFGMDYGLKDRFALDVKVAWVANRYRGRDLLHGPVDTGQYHSTLQDARIALRYQLRPDGEWAITPVIGAILPTHNYETRGHSAPGRGLKALQLGLGVGRDIAIGSRAAYLQGQYSYAIVERVENMYIDRSSADVELGVAVVPRLTMTAATALQRTHGGLEFPLPRDEHFHELFAFHDRAARANFLLFTTGGTFRAAEAIDIYASVVWTVSGQNTHAIKGLSIGTAWTFGQALRLAQRGAIVPPDRQRTRLLAGRALR